MSPTSCHFLVIQHTRKSIFASILCDKQFLYTAMLYLFWFSVTSNNAHNYEIIAKPVTVNIHLKFWYILL